MLTILRGLNDRKDIVVYMDVEPYDTQWLWLCEKSLELGIDIKILISIREEDFQRSPVDYSKHSFEEISIELSKEEAIEIYKMYPNSRYLLFEDAWKSFGEKGPLMEYTFMLNESKTLVDKIKAQIENIVNHEEQADSWLESLAIISLAGIHNNSVSINNLFQKVKCNQKFKMIKHFEKEYFIKITKDNTYVESLHALRARIIYNVLIEMGIFNKETTLINTLGVIEHNATQMLIEYVYEVGITEEFVNQIANIRYLSIEVYADIVKALLWCEIYHYSIINKEVIKEGDSIFNNQFMFLGNTDITGLLQMDLLSGICKIFEQVNPNFEKQMKKQLSKLPVLKLEYKYLDAFLIATYKSLSGQIQIKEIDLTAWGYVLFWMSYRNIYLIEISVDNINWHLNIEGTLNYLLGVSKQKWFDMRNRIVEKVMPSVLQQNGVIYYENTDNEIYILINVLLGNEQGEPHSRVVKMINICQRLFPEKEKYNVKICGYQLLGEVEIPDTQKNISQEQLPYVWITQLNSCFNNMHRYNTLPENWEDTYRNIVDARNAVLEYFKILLDGIEKFYRNENVCVFKTGNYEEKKVKAIRLTGINPYIEPKCAVDKYGIRVNNYFVEDRQDKYSNERRIESDKQHISNLCHEYFSHIHAFCENGEKILIDAKRGKQREEKSRIAYYSLIQALSELNVFQQRFDDYFRNIGIFPKSNLEVELLEKMAALFTIIFFNNFAREKSICYKAKENVRVTERKIIEFMKYGIKTLPGVKYASDKEKAVEVEVDIFKYKDFLSQLYHSVKKLAKEMDNLSLSGYLLQKHFRNLSVNLIYENGGIFRKVNIPVKNILIYKEYDKFSHTLLPNEEKGEILIENSSQAAVQGIASISSLKSMFTYTAEIEQELLNKPEDTIIEEVYRQYQENVISIICESVNLLKKVVDCISSNADVDYSVMTDVRAILEETSNQMQNVIFDVAKESTYEEIEEFFEQFTQVFCQYADASGIEIVR